MQYIVPEQLDEHLFQLRYANVKVPIDITFEFTDKGPGIADVRRATAGGYSTSGGLGLGLAGVRRLMDEFEIVSDVGIGTTVTAKKWKQ